MIAGPDAATPGEAKNSWLTGTAAWAFVSGTQGLLGIVPDYDGLRIDPCIPRSWPGYEMTVKLPRAEYRITVENPNGVNRGVARLELDGAELTDRSGIPIEQDGNVHQVRVVLG